jgi:hypothetical protein
MPYFGSWLRARKRWKNSTARRPPNLNVVVITFAARPRRKSDKCLERAPRSESQMQHHWGMKSLFRRTITKNPGQRRSSRSRGSQRAENCPSNPLVQNYRQPRCQRAIKATSDSEERALWRLQTFDDKVPRTPSALQQSAHRDNASAM